MVCGYEEGRGEAARQGLMLLSRLDSCPVFRTRDCLSHVSKRRVRARSFFQARFLSYSENGRFPVDRAQYGRVSNTGDYAMLGNPFGTIKMTVSNR